MAKRSNITIVVEHDSGLRTATIGGGSLRCRVFSRANFEAPSGDEAGAKSIRSICDHPGVYVLTGSAEQGCTVYIGQSDSVSERLGNYGRAESKLFWRTTAVLQTVDELSPGNLDFLESRLIDLADSAQGAIGFAIANRKKERHRIQPDREAIESEELFRQALTLLGAVGFDYFEVNEASNSTTAADPADQSGIPVAPRVADLLSRLLKTLTAFPQTTSYSTRVDYRVKVTRGDHFRPFARLRLAKNAITVRLKDVGKFKLSANDPINDQLTTASHEAYLKAVDFLDGNTRRQSKAASAS